MVNPKYSGGVDAENYEVEVNSIYPLIEKVARQVLSDVEVTDRLAMFDKAPIDNGTTIEEYCVKLAQSTAYDPDDTNPYDVVNPDIVVRYYNDWTHKVFKHTVYDNEVRKILLADGNTARVSASIVASLTKGDIYEKYLAVRNLLKYGFDNGLIVKQDGIEKGEYKSILKALKNVVDGMNFANADYNKAGIIRETPKKRIYILMPYWLKNEIDVEELAGVFNLDKAEIKNRIIPIDSGNIIYVVDEFAILSFTRLYQMASMPYNADNLSKNFVLHTDRLYAMSGLFDATAIAITDEITVDDGITGGTVEAPASGTWGEKITLTVTPEEGKSVSSVTVNGETIEPVEGVYSFIMPNEAVTVSATFA